MKIAFCYDIQENTPTYNQVEDMTAEYESSETLGFLEKNLEKLGEVINLPWHPDIFNDLKKIKPDVVFNITESWGSRNRESFIPNICEILEIPYTGSDGVALGVSLDKELTKYVAKSLQVRTPDFSKIESISELKDVQLNYPVFVKPNNEGSSKGIRRFSKISEEKELYKQVEKLLTRYDQPVLIEEFAPGREFAVAILGNKEPQVFPVAEIEVEGGKFSFYSYEFKGQHQKTIRCPAVIDEKMAKMMVMDALKVFKGLGCRDLARVDFKLDNEGLPTFLEINPLPGLSPYYSLYPVQAEAGGVSHEEIIEKLINFALKRGKRGKEFYV